MEKTDRLRWTLMVDCHVPVSQVPKTSQRHQDAKVLALELWNPHREVSHYGRGPRRIVDWTHFNSRHDDRRGAKRCRGDFGSESDRVGQGGGWIVYSAKTGGGDWDLFLMRPDGSNRRNIIPQHSMRQPLDFLPTEAGFSTIGSLRARALTTIATVPMTR
jgi:hypothetical protein